MVDRITDLEGRVDALAREVAELRSRLAEIEAQLVDGGERRSQPDATAASPPTEPFAARLPGLAGRTLVVLGGASLLRALTAAGTVSRSVGVASGLAYAAWWCVACDREAAAQRRASASFHGLAAAAITFPLVWEATVRLGVLSPAAAAVLVTAALALGVGVSVRRDLPLVASLTVVAALGTSLGLFVRTRDLVPFAAAVLVLAAAVETLTRRGRWPALRWPAAVGADAALYAAAAILARAEGPPEGYAAVSPALGVTLELSLPVLYLAAVALRTLVLGRGLTPFDAVQGAAAVALGLGGASQFLGAGAPALVGVLTAALGVLGYFAAFVILEPRGGRDAAFHFWASVGLVSWVVAGWLLLGPAAAAFAWSGLGLAGAWLARRRPAATPHAVALLVAAGAGSGQLRQAAAALVGSSGAPWDDVWSPGLAVTAACVAAYVLLAHGRPATSIAWRAGVAALAGAGLVGLTIRVVVDRLGLAPDDPAGAGAIAAVRTVTLSAAAVALTWSGRAPERRELRWLGYVMLGATGLKLVFEDLPAGRPGMAFVALTVYGSALVAASGIAGRRRA